MALDIIAPALTQQIIIIAIIVDFCVAILLYDCKNCSRCSVSRHNAVVNTTDRFAIAIVDLNFRSICVCIFMCAC